MPSINAISSILAGTNSAVPNSSALSEETIGKLLSLGIDINEVSSETEAKKLIEEAEKEEDKENENSSEDKTKNSEAENLYNDIKNLGRKVGINVSKNENIEDILDKISQRLEEFEENSYNSNLNVFQSELDILERQFKNLYSGESSILSAMDMLSQNKRAVLGI